VDGNWVATLAARLGWAADRWLFYTKVGGGWTRINASVLTPAGFTVATGNATNSGWLVGAGVEYAFAPNWTAKLEYNYLGLSDKTFATTIPPFAVTVSPDVQLLKVGFNYKF
jgi:opacity protein-like surface antigen